MVEERISKSLLVAGLEANKPIVREFKLEKDQSQKVYAVGFKVCKLAWLNSQWNVAAVLAGSEAGCLKVFNARFDNIV